MYLSDFSDEVASAFRYVGNFGCDVFKTLDRLLSGTAFSEVHDRGNPKYLNMSYLQLLERVHAEDNFDWESTKAEQNLRLDKYILEWTAWVLVLFQWMYRVDFRDWLKYFSVKDVYNMYYPLHETSLENAASKLKYNYDYCKKNKEFREKRDESKNNL